MAQTTVRTGDGDGDPLEALRGLEERRRELDDLERRLVLRARVAGASWRQVGAAVGVSAQAAHRKHRRDVP